MPYDHIDFTPPKGAQEAAKRALEVRESKPPSERGMTPVGLARARDLSNGRRLSPGTVRRMLAYFERHEGDKQGETWDAQGPGWQAWMGWGGDPGYAWARKVTAQLDAADAASGLADAYAATGAAIVLSLPEDEAAYLAVPGGLPPGDLHLTLVALPGPLDPDVARRVRDVLAQWAGRTPRLPARVSGVGRFAGTEGDCVYLSVDAPGLAFVREDLVRRLREASVEIASDHGFDPHVTVQYVPRDAPTPAQPAELPLDLVFAEASLWIGQERATVNLLGEADPRTLTEAATVRGEGLAITCRDAAEVGHRTWNQIARYGSFRGHPQGAFTFDARSFAEIVRNFNTTANRRAPLDYEHASEAHPPNVATEGVPALAWIVEIDDRGDAGLWALFEWVDPKAVAYVRQGQYRYLSPSVQFAARDKTTAQPIGARLTSVALTNRPFLDGMAPVVAAEPADPRRLGLPPGDVHVPSIPGKRPKETQTMAGPTPTLQTQTKPGADVCLRCCEACLACLVACLACATSCFDSACRAACVRCAQACAKCLAACAACGVGGDPAACAEACAACTDACAACAAACAAACSGDAAASAACAVACDACCRACDTCTAACTATLPADSRQGSEAPAGSETPAGTDKALADKHAAMADRLRKLAELGPEASEDEALEKIAGIVEKMRGAQKAEAEQMADRAIAGHGLSDKRRGALVAQALGDPTGFLETFPKAAAGAAAPALASERPAVAPETRTLLTTQVAPSTAHPMPGPLAGATIAEQSQARNTLAAGLLRDGKARTMSEALLVAEDQIKKQRAREAVAPFVGG